MKSWFIGTAEIIYSKKNDNNYLEIWLDKIPLLAWESKNSKTTWNVVQNFNKTVYMHTHNKDIPKDKQEIPEIKIKQWVNCGVLKLRISSKSGARILKGIIAKCPVIGWEDKRIRSKFHLVLDFEKLAADRSKNPNGADKAEVVYQNNA